MANIKFNTDKHQLQTGCVNKIALSEYDDKRYISSDQKTFEHISLGDKYLTKKMCVETDWYTELNEPYSVVELPEYGDASGWYTPDPGFQLSYSNEELNDVVDLLTLSDQSDDSNIEIINPFILNEAGESPDNSTSSCDTATKASISKRRKKAADVNRNYSMEARILFLETHIKLFLRTKNPQWFQWNSPVPLLRILTLIDWKILSLYC